MTKEGKIDISWMTFVRFFVVAGLLVLAYVLRSVLAMIFVSIIIAAALSPMVDWFQKKKVSRLVGALIIYLSIIALLSLIIYFAFPIIYAEIMNLADSLPGISEQVFHYISNSALGERISDFISSYQGSIIKDASQFFSILINLGGDIVSVLTVFLISFYLLLEKDGISDFIKFITPQSIESTVLKIWYRSRLRLGKWLRVQILLSTIIGAMVWVVLVILGVKYAFILAIFAALCELVPMVGPILAGVVATIVALTQSLPLAIWTAIAFILIQRLENDILVPAIMGKTIGFNPVIVLVALFAGGKLGGVLGMLIALPVVIVVEEIIKELNKKKQQRLEVAPLP